MEDFSCVWQKDAPLRCMSELSQTEVLLQVGYQGKRDLRSVVVFKKMFVLSILCVFFFFNDTATTEIYTLSLHDALPI